MSYLFFFFSSRRRHTRFDCDWSSDVCSSDLGERRRACRAPGIRRRGSDRPARAAAASSRARRTGREGTRDSRRRRGRARTRGRPRRGGRSPRAPPPPPGGLARTPPRRCRGARRATEPARRETRRGLRRGCRARRARRPSDESARRLCASRRRSGRAAPRARSERLDRFARELVRSLVQRVAAVATHLVPDELVAPALGEQPIPAIAIGDRLLLPVLPAGLLPALPPALTKAVHDVGAVRVEVDAPLARDRGEPLDGGRELHALIRRVRLGTADDALLAGVEDDRRP